MFEKILEKYNNQLSELFARDPKVVECYVYMQRLNKDKLNGKKINELKLFYLKTRSIKTFHLLENLQHDLIEYMQAHNKKIQHITTLSPEQLKGQIKPVENTTIYGEDRNKFVFGSATELSKLGYSARAYNGGMIALNKSDVLFPSCQNFDIIKGEILLKKPVYCYLMDASEFKPVVSLAIINGKPSILFDDEWVAEKPQKVTNENVEVVDNITPLCKYEQIYALNSDNLSQKSIEELKKIFDDKKNINTLLDRGKLLDINYEINNVFTNKI